MPLNLYDVIFWEADGQPDTIYTVTAATHLAAVELAEQDRSNRSSSEPTLSHQADAVSLLGHSLLDCEPQILHGPFRETGYTRGKTWLFDRRTKQWLPKDDHDKTHAE